MRHTRQIINGDCIEKMRKIKTNSVHLVITDPPFAIDFKEGHKAYNRKKEKVIAGYKDIDPEEYEQFTKRWLMQVQRVLRSDGSMYIISGFNNLNIIENTLKFFGFHVQNHIIWKYQFGVVQEKICHIPLSCIVCHKTQDKIQFLSQ